MKFVGTQTVRRFDELLNIRAIRAGRTVERPQEGGKAQQRQEDRDVDARPHSLGARSEPEDDDDGRREERPVAQAIEPVSWHALFQSQRQICQAAGKRHP